MESQIRRETNQVGSTYQITVKGHIDSSFIKRISDLTLSNLEADDYVLSTLTGSIKDQSELNGLLNILHDHQYEVISVNKIG